MIKRIAIDSIIGNEKNPRYIKEKKYNELKESIENFPFFMNLKPIIIDGDNVVIAGNQRLKACKELDWPDIPAQYFTKQDSEKMNFQRSENGLELKSYQEFKDEIIIKDNLHSGAWDNDILANEWNTEQLNSWGLEIWDVENVDLDNFFEEDKENEQKQNIDKIILEYTPDDYSKVISKLTEIGGSKEQAIFKSLGL